MIKALAVATAILLGTWTQMAEAVPITYLGTLQSGVPVSDTVPDGGPNNPTLADYWQFTLTQAAQITITGHRLEGDLDPALHLFRGTFTDTDQFGGSLGGGSIARLAFGDDQLAPALPGPFGDPFVSIQLPEGTYTVAFVSFANGQSSGPWGYCLELNGPATNCADRQVPAPASLLLLGLGAIGIGSLRYGRRRR
jgi:PEP-CTERM motif